MMDNKNDSGREPSISTEAVLKSTSKSIWNKLETPVRGYTFEDEQGRPRLDYEQLLNNFMQTGFQATHFATAVKIIRDMLDVRKHQSCTIFLSYTSNMISSGIRENVRFLVKNKLVDCIVTTAGGIEEDIIKCLADTYVGDFRLSGGFLREHGVNRIGNLLVPNDNYCKFEDWLIPILDRMLDEQSKSNGQLVWTPSKLIHRLGLEIDHPDSVCYWAAKHNIPIFCPAITDGSLGDMLHFHTFRSPGLILDLVADIRRINTIAHNTESSKTGAIILGGGVAKHHTMNANLMRNGADYTVFVNTAAEFDGSDSGAEPDEAVSWGKIRAEAKSVKLTCDASIAFPLLVSQTFFKFIQAED